MIKVVANMPTGTTGPRAGDKPSGEDRRRGVLVPTMNAGMVQVFEPDDVRDEAVVGGIDDD